MVSWSDLYGSHPQTSSGDCPQAWVFTGEMRDEGRYGETCPCCQKQDFRVTYEVREQGKGISFWVCLECICQDDVTAKIDDCAIIGQARRDHLGRLAVRLMHESCRDIIRRVLLVSCDPDLPEIAVYFDRNGQLSPGRAAVLFTALAECGIEVDARTFEVQIRSAAHKKEFALLSEQQKLIVWPALSPAIRKKFSALRTAPKRRTLSQALERPVAAK